MGGLPFLLFHHDESSSISTEEHQPMYPQSLQSQASKCVQILHCKIVMKFLLRNQYHSFFVITNIHGISAFQNVLLHSSNVKIYFCM